MSKNSHTRWLIIGVGNPDRGDDGVGHAVIRALRKLSLPDVELMSVPGEATQLIETWKAAGRVVVIDASNSGADAGTIRRFDAHAGELPALLERTSTHGFGVAEAVAIARNINCLPDYLHIITIEGAGFEPGMALSSAAAAAAESIAVQLADGLYNPQENR